MRWTLLLSFALIAVSRPTVQGVQGEGGGWEEGGWRDSRLDSTVFHGWGEGNGLYVPASRSGVACKQTAFCYLILPGRRHFGTWDQLFETETGVHRPRITTNPRLFRVHSSIAGRRIGRFSELILFIIGYFQSVFDFDSAMIYNKLGRYFCSAYM